MLLLLLHLIIAQFFFFFLREVRNLNFHVKCGQRTLYVKWHNNVCRDRCGLLLLRLDTLTISKERGCLRGGEWPEERHNEGKMNKSKQKASLILCTR